MGRYDKDTPIMVRYEPDHETPGFDEDGTPVLTFGRHPDYGPGWTLSFLEPDGNGVEAHFIPGDLLDVDHAVESAQGWLDLVGKSEAE